MAQFLGFGSGSDGDLDIAANTTEAPIDSTAVTSGANLTATNPSFVANQMIMIHQSQGTGAGGWEVNQIQSYSVGVLTPQVTQVNTYGTGAQVRVLPQYKSVTVESGKTYTAKAWNGSVGGLLGWLCTGSVNIIGGLSASGCGFRGAPTGSGQQLTGRRGEGTTGNDQARSSTAQGNGGGGGGGSGDAFGGTFLSAGGGGGGLGTSGTNGNLEGAGNSSTDYGRGGNTAGSSDLITMVFGGGGGESGTRNNTDTTSGTCGTGGGIIFIITSTFVNSGTVVCNGTDASAGDAPESNGAGAGGSILIKSNVATIGNGTVTALGGAGTKGTASGGNGIIRIEACTLTDSSNDTNPASSRSIGGLAWCFVPGTMV